MPAPASARAHGARVPVTMRVAALAMLLALLSNLALIGFVWWRTHDDALAALRGQAVEQARALSDVYADGGVRALRATIADLRDAGDPRFVAALLDGAGRPRDGNIVSHIPGAERHVAGFQIVRLHAAGTAATEEAGVVIRPLGRAGWLVSGLTFSERLTLQRTLERSLALAVVLSLLFGLLCGLVTAGYVGSRVRAIAVSVDEVGAGDLARRAPITGSGDAFDLLSTRINLMLDRISALMAELRLLTDSLAHDLRSPVGRLRARIERAMTTEDEAQREALLGGVLQETDALMRILTTVLEIGRSEAMAGRERFAALDPADLAAELAEMYEPLAEEAGVALVLEATPGISPARFAGHRQMLAQALSNLIDNALHYGAAGGTIALFVGVEGDMLHLGVADRGPGIAAGDEAEARRRFGRLDHSRSAPGAGLGLALVEAVAHLHGGTLRLDDNRPGLRATLLLPMARNSA
ncbi:sensor histidine kinase [Sphingomonas solaris]|uniref:histidine kinase n=1 Tax=Alterirhizorhabdus solaris TaxID=2529389 RepID=A0A558QXQ2_9SPHN|nr:HAMP domain-containing sensor histidine kinase [Sphingomonas solaris]TVV71934.1 HAMP domain-containing histidine kinase [Sphingomonas solaris]